jgi:hypothetical protein
MCFFIGFGTKGKTDVFLGLFLCPLNVGRALNSKRLNTEI